MTHAALKALTGLVLLATPLAACSSGTATGAAGGAVTGAVVGGPVGAAVGGVAGAAVGSALSADENTRVREYVVTQRVAPVTYREEIVVGQTVPTRIRLYPVPQSVGLTNRYSYTVVNNRTLVVDPVTREVVEVID